MATRVDTFPMAFVLVPDGQVTQRMLNLSTSTSKDAAPLLEGKRLLETWVPINTVFLDFPLLTPDEARALVADANDGEVDAPWWRRLLGLD